MERAIGKNIQNYEKTKSAVEDYGKAREIYEKYLELRRKAGKPRRKLMDINEMEKNLRAMGAAEPK